MPLCERDPVGVGEGVCVLDGDTVGDSVTPATPTRGVQDKDARIVRSLSAAIIQLSPTTSQDLSHPCSKHTQGPGTGTRAHKMKDKGSAND